jgi:hypothetical protein
MHSQTATQVALAAAALFLGACHHDEKPTSHPDDAASSAAAPDGADASKQASAKLKCFGVNACSGQGACDVPDGRVAAGSKGTACAGQNECSGKGWLLLTQAECDEKKGQPL